MPGRRTEPATAPRPRPPARSCRHRPGPSASPGGWNARQAACWAAREERVTVVLGGVQAGAGGDEPLVLDRGCGPGSLAVRLLRRMPAARVVAIDTDPLLRALGRAAFCGRSGLRF